MWYRHPKCQLQEPPRTVEGAEKERGIGRREMGSEGINRMGAPSSLFLTLFLAGIYSLYSPYPDDYRILVSLQFKVIECLLLSACTRSSHSIIPCNSCVESAVHRVCQSLPQSWRVCTMAFCQAPFQCILFSHFIIFSLLISSHSRHLL